MKAIGKNIYLGLEEAATLLGVGGEAIRVAVNRGDAHWQGIKDPDDNRALLLSYEAMKPKYKQMIAAHYGNPEQMLMLIEQQQQHNALRLRMQRRLLPLPQADALYLNSWRSAAGAALPDAELTGYQTGCRWLHSLNEWQGHGSRWYKNVLGAQASGMVWQNVIAVIKDDKLPLPTNYSRLTQKVAAYRQQGAQAVLARAWRYGNSNAQKLRHEHRQTLLALMCDPEGRKFTYPQIHAQFIALAREQGWAELLEPKPITVAAISQWLEQPEQKNVWYLHRYGGKAWSDRNELVIPQQRSAEPHLQWQIDGFQQNMWYWDGKTMRKLYTVRIIDSYSGAIVGWSVGINENAQMVFEATKMACMVHGVMPHEIKTDNSSAMKAAETAQLFTALGIRVVHTQPHKGRSKKIEPHSVWLKKQIEEYYTNVSGGNITARTLNSRNNPDTIKSNAKGFPDMQGLVAQINQLHARWNVHTGADGSKQSPSELLRHDAPRLRLLTLEDRMRCFWVFRRKGANLLTYNCTNKGIVVTLPNGSKQTYHPVLPDAQPLSAWLNAHIGRSFAVKYDRTDTDTIALYDRAGEQFICYAAAAERVSEAVTDLKAGDGLRLQRYLAEQKAQKQQAREPGDKALEYVRANQILDGAITFERVFKDTHLAAEEELDRLFSLGYLPTEVVMPGSKGAAAPQTTTPAHYEEDEEDDLYATLGTQALNSTRFLKTATEED